MPTIHQLSLSGGDLSVDVTINGFPLHQGPLDGSSSMVLNPYLIGAGNELRLAISNRGPGAEFAGALQQLKPGDMADTMASGDFKLPSSTAPQEFTHRFDSKLACFRKVLDSAKPAKPAALLPLAINLRDLLRKRDAAGLLRLFQPKIATFAEAFEAPADAMKADLESGFAEFFDSDLAFEPADVEVVSHCDGKIHAIRRKGGKPLIHKEVDGGAASMAVFAALLPSGPAVVA